MESFGGPEWNFVEVPLAEAPNEKNVLVYQDIEKCADHLFGTPNFSRQIAVKPTVVRGLDDKTRVFEETWDADELNKAQVRI
jgi:hypothetical protein